MSTDMKTRGSAYGDDPEVHRLVDETFRCTAAEDAPCRTNPTCECETWCACDGSPQDASDNHEEGEHCCMTTRRPGLPCWIEPWVNASDIEDSCGHPYEELRDRLVDTDDGLVWQDGPVTCDWDYDHILWHYADPTRTVHPPGAADTHTTGAGA